MTEENSSAVTSISSRDLRRPSAAYFFNDLVESAEKLTTSATSDLTNQRQTSGQKRKCQPDEASMSTAPKKQRLGHSPMGKGSTGLPADSTKNAVSVLNERFPGLDYTEVSRTGPSHAPVFTMDVCVNGQVFRGVGGSKKAAKVNAAEQALAALKNQVGSLAGQRNEVDTDNDNEDSVAAGGVGQEGGSGQGGGVRRGGGGESGEGGGAKRGEVSRSVTGGKRSDAIALLNEFLSPTALEYELRSCTGPPHAPVFTVSVMYDGRDFTGTGKSKKLAKAMAAESLLASLRDGGIEITRSAKRTHSDEEDEGSNGNGGEGMRDTFSSPVAVGDRNPVMILNELRPGTVYRVISETGQSHAKMFVVSVSKDSVEYTGAGSNKKIAKMRAAKAVLEASGYVFPVQPGMETVNPGDSSGARGASRPVASALADHVSALIMNKYEELCAPLAPQFQRRKVLAGIVMTRGAEDATDFKNSTVISVTTGTKCLSGESMSLQGSALNDCHAEILARRGLRAYLYEQLYAMAERREQNGEEGGEGERNEDWERGDTNQLILMRSTSPCGDGRIFSPRDEATEAGDDQAATVGGDRHPNRIARGQLRTKIESGEGTILVNGGMGGGGAVQQTWDGVLQGGERLLTMSCSDKVTKWNVLGLQGSMLSRYLEPIYLSSVIVGSCYHSDHLSRALYGRLAGTQLTETLPAGYRLNRPMLSTITNTEVRQPSKSPNHAGVWVIGDGMMEVVNAGSGVKEPEGTPSRLSKQSMFRLFTGLWTKLPPPKFLSNSTAQVNTKGVSGSNGVSATPPPPQFYSDAKASATEYQLAKAAMFKAFEGSRLGRWVKHPIEQDEFHL